MNYLRGMISMYGLRPRVFSPGNIDFNNKRDTELELRIKKLQSCELIHM